MGRLRLTVSAPSSYVMSVAKETHFPGTKLGVSCFVDDGQTINVCVFVKNINKLCFKMLCYFVKASSVLHVLVGWSFCRLNRHWNNLSAYTENNLIASSSRFTAI